MYNTVTDVTDGGANSPVWQWADSDNFGNNIFLSLHNENTPGAIRTDLDWELPVHIYDMDDDALVNDIIITGDATSVLPNSASVSADQQFSAVITHVDFTEDIDAAAAWPTTAPKIVSNFDIGSSVNGSIKTGTGHRELIIHSAKGNSADIASDSGYELTGELLHLTKMNTSYPCTEI